MTERWRLSLLGGLRLERRSEVVTRFRTSKASALLAFLACHAGTDFGREELALRFWPEQDDLAARASLRVALTHLRHILEAPPTMRGSVLCTTRTHVRLIPETLEVDVLAFEQALRQRNWELASTLYRGPLLPGNYDEWVLAERERLEARAAVIPLGRERTLPSAVPTPLYPTALPVTLTRFFGRDVEQAQLTLLLLDPSVRLITLTGPGGMGKTRLAVQTLQDLLREKPGALATLLPGGIWFVPLAALRDPTGLSAAALAALGKGVGADPLESLVETLLGTPAILVLDNAEQLIEGVAAWVQTILMRLPELSLLVTSRVRLNVPGETLLRLSLLTNTEAAGLFADRARAADVDFSLGTRNADAVATLCQELECMPLALELAAAWAGVQTPQQMLSCLTKSLNAFPRRHRGGEERHRTLRAAIQWSYDLLTPSLQAFFSALSVFRGGFSTAAATAITGSLDATSQLAELLDASLIVRQNVASPDARFDLLESLRIFGEEQLTPEQHAVLCEHHAAYFAHLSHGLKVQDGANLEAVLAYAQERSDWETVLRVLFLHHGIWTFVAGTTRVRDLLRTTLHRAERSDSAEEQLLFQGYTALTFMEYFRGEFRSALDAQEHRMEKTSHLQPTEKQALQASLAMIQMHLGQLETAEMLLRQLEPLSLADTTTEGSSLLARTLGGLIPVGLAECALRRDDLPAALDCTERAQSFYDAFVLHNPKDQSLLALTLGLRCSLAERAGRFEEALRSVQEALVLYQGQPVRLAELSNRRAALLLASGQHAAARVALEDALPRIRQHEQLREVVIASESVTRLLLDANRLKEARHLLGYSRSFNAAYPFCRLPTEQERLDRLIAALHPLPRITLLPLSGLLDACMTGLSTLS